MSDIELSVFYFPNFHKGDKHNEAWHGHDWTEWNLMKHAKPRFEGHEIPTPLWGYEDESDPDVMEKKIKAMKDHAITNVLFDWYWYEDGPFLNKCLEEGFLKAKNNKDIKFSLMWANHNWLDIHPISLAYYHHQLVELSGHQSVESIYKAFAYIIKNYFSQDNYYKIENKLFFSIYEINMLVDSFGGLEEAKEGLKVFRNMVREAGLGELHLNAVVWGCRVLQGESEKTIDGEALKEIGFDSVTSYVWVHEHPIPTFPAYEYKDFVNDAKGDFERLTKQYKGLPYYPNISVGWDASARANQTDNFVNVGYPFGGVVINNTPEVFKSACEMVKEEILKSDLKTKMITINAWNEWTEGSYLEPDTKYGYKKLEVLKEVFGK
ncbi:MAG: glycoside hydrolase family 99-like domain-containing protein [Bacilli bacterium]|nr:glycoside hydrolase family 99-like domain-containing protein [Bacilli bacterium]